MSEYSMVSVPKEGANPGTPRGKKNVIIVLDFDNYTMATDEKNVKVTALTAVDDKKLPIGIFVNQNSLDCGDELEGEAYSRGLLPHVNFDHPGTSQAINEFKNNCMNANLGVIVVECDSSATTAKLYGRPCAPLVMQQAQEQDTNEAHLNHFELRAEQRGWGVAIIDKTDIPVTDNATINAYLGLPVPSQTPG